MTRYSSGLQHSDWALMSTSGVHFGEQDQVIAHGTEKVVKAIAASAFDTSDMYVESPDGSHQVTAGFGSSQWTKVDW